MAITTFAELQTAMGNWLDRTDLSSRLPEFIALFEAQVNRRLLLRPQTTTTTLTVTSGVAALPSDYLEWKRVTWQGTSKRELDYVTPSYLSASNPTDASANPIYFTIEGSNLKVSMLSDEDLELLYSQKVPALSVSATTNWLLTSHPDAYLFGSLTMAATLTGEADNGSAWNALTQNVLGELWGLDFKQRGTMVQRASGPMP
jgi:hypothetical protein